MISGVVGFPCILLNHDPFRIARATGNFPIHIVFPVTTTRKPPFPILKCTSSDVARKRLPVALLERCQQIVRLFRRDLLSAIARSG